MQETANISTLSKIERMRIPCFHVDAFASRPFSGNPAAVCFLDSWLDDAMLRKVAAENNLPATAFLVECGQSHEIRWFTARREINLCGHGTLAAGFVLLNLTQKSRDRAEFVTRHSGMVAVEKAGEFLRMDFPALAAQPSSQPPERFTKALGLSSAPAEVFEAGERYIAVLNQREMVANASPDFELLKNFYPYVVAITAPGENEDFVSRYFAPGYGTPEDYVTGSLHCALTPYWSKRLGKTQMHARQLSERGGELRCEMSGDRVILKGKAVLVMQGYLTI
ncbi:MAG TPA: PhzF family phenazine biosynthesis protein [Candidatus Sulfotelmatobacter sp.]|nr:PhzF family phenazine biosynthesis protein [Candidatus Sulfotelmatobacter sp.]